MHSDQSTPTEAELRLDIRALQSAIAAERRLAQRMEHRFESAQDRFHRDRQQFERTLRSKDEQLMSMGTELERLRSLVLEQQASLEEQQSVLQSIFLSKSWRFMNWFRALRG